MSFEIPKTSHFQLIGRGGSVIRSLRSRFDVNITIPHRNSRSNTVTIEGTDDNIAGCKEAIEEILGFGIGNDPLVRVHLTIEKSDYGSLIGSRGSTINRLERTHGVDIDIPRRSSPRGYVVVSGASDKVAACTREIEGIVGYEIDAEHASGEEFDEDADQDGFVPPKFHVDYTKPLNETLHFPDPSADDGWNFDRFCAYLDSAEESIDVCVFNLTHNQIANILKREFKSGTKVRIISDNDTSVDLGNDVKALAQFGIPVKVDVSGDHMHNKFAIIDGKLLMNGSFNWTVSASTRNKENVMITNNEEFVKDFADEFERMWADEKAYTNVE